jgi:2,3-bisphosphoglycerate-independent phosphoglycerate mutase
MDPHRTDGRTLEVDKADFADTEEAKARLRTAVNEYMGERTTVVSAWRVYDARREQRLHQRQALLPRRH